MFKTTRILLFIILIAAVFVGGNQLSSDNDVFAKAMLPCCNNGQCHDMNCTTGSSILPCSRNGYSADCEWCMEIIPALMLCDLYLGPENTWCVYSDGTKHYPGLL